MSENFKIYLGSEIPQVFFFDGFSAAGQLLSASLVMTV
jgi:hypothetical protein